MTAPERALLEALELVARMKLRTTPTRGIDGQAPKGAWIRWMEHADWERLHRLLGALARAEYDERWGDLDGTRRSLARLQESVMLAEAPPTAALREAAEAVIADHDERLRIYTEKHEGQPHRIKVMEQLRAALKEAP